MSKVGWTKCRWCQQWQRTSITPNSKRSGNRRICVYCEKTFKVRYKLDKLPKDARPENPKINW